MLCKVIMRARKLIVIAIAAVMIKTMAHVIAMTCSLGSINKEE